MMNYKLKAEIIVENTDKNTTQKIFYECDPDLNTECNKRSCGDCKHTSNISFAKRFDVFDD